VTDRYNGEYDDIINMEKPVSVKRVKMPMIDRAAQFAPFAALTGFDSQISETARLTEQKPVLSDYELEELNEKITHILDNIKSRPELEVIYFVKDSKKSGGAIEHYIGNLRKFDFYKRIFIFEDCKKIPADDIIDIKQEII
jgi:hypothetical protein